MRSNQERYFKILQVLLAILYSSFFIYAVFFARRRRHITARTINLTPVKHMLRESENIIEIGAFNFYSNLFGNIVLFMPVPFIVLWFFKIKQRLYIILIGFIVSLAVEILQYIFEIGVADIDDIILNTLGTCFGLYLYRALTKVNPLFFP